MLTSDEMISTFGLAVTAIVWDMMYMPRLAMFYRISAGRGFSELSAEPRNTVHSLRL